MRRTLTLAALAVAVVALVLLLVAPELLWRATAALGLAFVGLARVVLPIDEQEARAGRPRRGGLGGGTSETPTSTPADESGADRPRPRNRPRRGGF